MIVERSLYPHQLQPGDIVAVGRRFYAVDGSRPYMLGYHRVMLRNLADGTRGVYEFRAEFVCDVLREAS